MNFWFIYFQIFLLKLPFIAGSLLPIFFIPYVKKNSLKERKLYSPIDKLLHYIFLGNKNVANFIFSIELFLYRKRLKEYKSGQNVYVSGLARAGTTVLMQYLGQLEEFKSISYFNLPLLFFT